MKKIIFYSLFILSMSCQQPKSNVEEDLQSINNSLIVEDTIPSTDTIIEQIPKEEKIVEIDTAKASELHDKALKILIDGGNLDEAVVLIDKAISFNPNSDSYYVKGNIQQRMSSFSDAIDSFKKAIELNPKNPDPYLKCGIIYGKLNDRANSCKYLKSACDLGNNDACTGVSRFCN